MLLAPCPGDRTGFELGSECLPHHLGLPLTVIYPLELGTKSLFSVTVFILNELTGIKRGKDGENGFKGKKLAIALDRLHGGRWVPFSLPLPSA